MLYYSCSNTRLERTFLKTFKLWKPKAKYLYYLEEVLSSPKQD